ncbi:uncharacterized protein BDZ99DRAFT_482310 [Mytilinidion resinicola]|uniref:Uncharacterized protein n=1 Tax=Mytilinidion resinicola TaxID=574789 RepID=A0A6A6Y2P1_9PEZI|nr:uncharacterized protein BDZ99DRAFT_482310 [Mytilinidion resinicola]KAF2803081.1 hypothetical protein BDZ99DRAFT_482310 [Mytilinidion resinicola]
MCQHTIILFSCGYNEFDDDATSLCWKREQWALRGKQCPEIEFIPKQVSYSCLACGDTSSRVARFHWRMEEDQSYEIRRHENGQALKTPEEEEKATDTKAEHKGSRVDVELGGQNDDIAEQKNHRSAREISIYLGPMEVVVSIRRSGNGESSVNGGG